MEQSGSSSNRAVSFLCCIGLFCSGCVFYSSSLMESFYASEFALTSWQIGSAQSAVPLGAMLGAIFAGRLADFLGRHRLLVWNFLLLVIIGLGSGLTFDFYSLCFSRLMLGFLAGTLYPLCAAYLTEMTPQESIARQTAYMLFINCLAAPVTCIVAILLSCICNEHSLWRVISACQAAPAIIAYLWSRKLPESRAWLLCEEKLSRSASDKKMTATNLFGGMRVLFNPTYRNVTLCLISTWFLMDIAYYGIMFFVPYLLQVIQIRSISNFNAHYHTLLSSETVWGTFIINFFFMLGAFASVFIVERMNLTTLQKRGFLFSSLSLFLLAAYFYAGLHHAYIVILLFMLYNFSLNIGPGVTTYLLSATSYPVEIRGSGHGFVAGFAKFGSFLGVLFLPKIQDLWGYESVILILSILLFSAYLFTINLSKAIVKDNATEAEIAYETT